MVGIVFHVDLPRGIDVEFEAAFDPLEGRQRTPQSLCVERPSFGAGGAPHRRDGRHGVFDVDPAGDPQRACLLYTSELVPRTGSHTVIFGSPDDAEEKLAKLLTFYRRGLRNIGWEEYRTINVKYKEQVVCTK